MSDEREYGNFVISENLINRELGSDVVSEDEITITNIEKNKIIRIIIRKLLYQSPFPLKYEELKAIVKEHLPYKFNPKLINHLLYEIKHLLSNTFGLYLDDVKFQPNKRELILKQTVSFKHHDLKTLTEGDHELRGFILLLVPCFKAYNNILTLKFLCDLFVKIHKVHMVPRCTEEEKDLITVLKMVKRKKEVKYTSKEYNYISDYILYAKDLSYINIVYNSEQTDLLASVSVVPGYRLSSEFDMENFVAVFRRLDQDKYDKALNIFFE
ncbi:hypothetical protein TpMuguga_03g00362 [Theileria parva strain Muguga]|uniref:Uncharacterized protein n=1 Tax=Theileria parva TaxID=5875 RepID=Q4MZZ2_THEPA|nr:uncharacterized protein TpMuguga_03g00362 [Theileria parva strain Muguga]EAN31099.1 hypothetical protein TpMuguga_03g00362 [Theileria parva strain Muguga]|eukprot:XP_763382.1 hypothetical protein [Theileria parva strain Muguga]